jgi:glycosyltransferase involved in cell wall biosynthesis
MDRVFDAHLPRSKISRQDAKALRKNSWRLGGFARASSPEDSPNHSTSEISESLEVLRKPSILALATQGTGGDDETRLLSLLADFSPEVFPFDRRGKRRSFRHLVKTIFQLRPDLVVMEGTGLAGGLALLVGRWLAGVPYVVSSGDAVGPFVAGLRPWLGPLFALYERLLCRWSGGFIGWTPYLTGRALTFGAPRAMTAPGWAPFPLSPEIQAASRPRIRQELGVAADDLVFGLVGSLAWTKRVGYCYGLELVRALDQTSRRNLKVVIVGDGPGRSRLEETAGKRLGTGVILTGRVTRNQVPHYLAALDVASLPQSVDQVGSFRYTTKLSEYLAAGLPIVTGQIPLAYDLGDDWLWRLPGKAPWDARYISALASLMQTLNLAELKGKQSAVPRSLPEFDRGCQVRRVAAWIRDVLDECHGHDAE